MNIFEKVKKKHNYIMFSMRVDKDLFHTFKEACIANGVSMSSVIKNIIKNSVDNYKNSGKI
jgi:hypothetical protein